MKRLVACLLLALAWPAPGAERVISLAPSLTEMVIELGAADLLVGVLDGGARPAEAANVPSVGRYGQLNMERLLSLKPDLLLLWPGSVGVVQREQLQRLNIALYTAEPHTLDQLATELERVGEQLGRAERGRALAQAFRQRLAELRQRYRRDVPLRVFYQVWDRPLYTVGGGQIVSDALKVCGGENVFADLSLPAPQVSVESVLQRKPDVIVVGDQTQLDAWKAWPLGSRLVVLPDKGLERPSGQMIGAIEKLCAAMAP